MRPKNVEHGHASSHAPWVRPSRVGKGRPAATAASIMNKKKE